MKKIILILLLIPFLSQGQMSSETKHKIAGHVTSLAVGHVVYYKTRKLGISIGASFVSGVLIGIAKEEYDKYNGGHSTREDIYDTSWGSAVGTVNFLMTFNMNHGSRKRKFKNIKYYQLD